MTREVLNYNEDLIAGDVEIIDVLIAASQTIVRGDLLVCAVTETFTSTSVAQEGTPNTVTTTTTVARTVADAFSKIGAVANVKDIHAIALAPLTTDGSTTDQKIPVIIRGKVNENQVNVYSGTTKANNAKVLRKQGIHMVPAQSGTIS